MTAKKQNNKIELSELVSLTNLTTYFTWIKYAEDDNGKNMSDDPVGKSYVGIAYNKDTIEESTNPEDYTWSRFRGENGKDGLPGDTGKDGKTTYFHIKYSHLEYPLTSQDMQEEPAEFIGTYVDFIEIDSEDPGRYKWHRLEGIQGEKGENGIPGGQGPDGKPAYLHIKYSNDGGRTFTHPNGETPGEWFGQYTDDQVRDSDDPSRYKWAKIKGEPGQQGLQGIQGNDGKDGVQGNPGADGRTTYFHIKYSHLERPQYSYQMQELPAEYIGTYVDFEQKDSNDPNRYTWYRFQGLQGAKGENGIPGGRGPDGKPAYLHIKYSNDGGRTFTARNGEEPGEWIGQYTDDQIVDSLVPSRYKWSKIKGEDGRAFTVKGELSSTDELFRLQGKEGEAYIVQGNLWGWVISPGGRGSWVNLGRIKGEDGKDGITFYTWIKYADDTVGTGMSDNPAGKKYIGIAYNKTSQIEINDYRLYTWSKIQADDFTIEGTLSSTSKLPPKGRPGMCYIIGKNLWMWKEDPRTGIGSWADMGQFIGSDGKPGAKVVVANTPLKEWIKTDWEIHGKKGRVENWTGVVNVSEMKKDDIIVINGVVTDRDRIGASIYALITGISGNTVTATSQTLIMGNQGQQGEQGRSIIIADTDLKYVLYSALDDYMRETEIYWAAIRNASVIKKGDILGVRHCITDKKNAIAVFYYLVQRIEGTTVYGKPLYYQMGLEGPAGPILDWVQEWDGTKTTIGGKKVLSPRIFAGTVSGGKPTGVALGENCFGSLNGYQSVKGLCAYHDGNQTFSVTSNGDVYFGDPTGRNGLIQYNAGDLSIKANTITFKGSELEDTLGGSGGNNLLKNGEAKLGILHWSDNGNGISSVEDKYHGTCFRFQTTSSGVIAGIKGDTISLKPNTDYVYQAMIYANETIGGSSIAPVHFWCKTASESNGLSACDIIDYDQNYNTPAKWKRLYVHFKTKNIENIKFNPFIYGSASPNSWIRATQLMLTEGTLPKAYSAHPDEISTSTVTVTDEGLTVKSNGSSSRTIVDESSFRVVGDGGATVAEFGKYSTIPELQATQAVITGDIINDKIVKKLDSEGTVKYYVNSTTGRDSNDGLKETQDSNSPNHGPFKTIERVLKEIHMFDGRDIYVSVKGHHSGFNVNSFMGPGLLAFSFDGDVVINGTIHIKGSHRVTLTRPSGSPTIKDGQILVSNSKVVDIDGFTFSYSRNGLFNHNVVASASTQVLVRFCDLGHTGSGSSSCIKSVNSIVYCYGCRGSECGHVILCHAYSIIVFGRGSVPDYTQGLCDTSVDGGTCVIHDGGGHFKSPSAGYNPVYRPTQRVSTWTFNNYYSTENMNGYRTKYELIQGRADVWTTGRWTGYAKRSDNMADLRNTVSGSTNVSMRFWIQRKNSSGVSQGGIVKLYTSNGITVTNTTRLNWGGGTWINLPSSAVNAILSGAATYFYVAAPENNQSTYMKFEQNCKLEVTYTK